MDPNPDDHHYPDLPILVHLLQERDSLSQPSVPQNDFWGPLMNAIELYRSSASDSAEPEEPANCLGPLEAYLEDLIFQPLASTCPWV